MLYLLESELSKTGKSEDWPNFSTRVARLPSEDPRENGIAAFDSAAFDSAAFDSAQAAVLLPKNSLTGSKFEG